MTIFSLLGLPVRTIEVVFLEGLPLPITLILYEIYEGAFAPPNYLLYRARISSFVFVPTALPISTPFCTTIVVGTERTLYCAAVCGDESTSINVIDISDWRDSITGLKALHGPHHVLEK
jgi:hypothetical protein